jgi:hypothetical protein
VANNVERLEIVGAALALKDRTSRPLGIIKTGSTNCLSLTVTVNSHAQIE